MGKAFFCKSFWVDGLLKQHLFFLVLIKLCQTPSNIYEESVQV